MTVSYQHIASCDVPFCCRCVQIRTPLCIPLRSRETIFAIPTVHASTNSVVISLSYRLLRPMNPHFPILNLLLAPRNVWGCSCRHTLDWVLAKTLPVWFGLPPHRSTSCIRKASGGALVAQGTPNIKLGHEFAASG